MDSITTMISTLGFPIVACVALFFGCKYMIDNNNKYVEKMFSMYEKSNEENRAAIEACTKAVDRLCDRLEDKDYGKTIKFGD